MQSLVRKLPCLWDQNKIVEGSLGGTGTTFPPREARESGSLHGEHLLPLHCLFTFLLPFSQSLHTLSWAVPVPSSVSCVLVVHINYIFKKKRKKNIAL